jgi:DNA-binding response OmpR family regulator
MSDIYYRSSRIKILIYQSAQDASAMLSSLLKNYGYTIIESTADTVEKLIMMKDYDMCIFDMKDGISDLSIIEFFKSQKIGIPCMIVSDNKNKQTIARAFDLGIDDYIARPYSIEELVRRIEAVARRLVRHTCGTTYNIGRYKLETSTGQLYLDGVEFKKLRDKSMTFLAILCENKGEFVYSDSLLIKIWGESTFYTRRCVYTLVKVLRKTLIHDPSIQIVGVRKQGESGYILKES